MLPAQGSRTNRVMTHTRQDPGSPADAASGRPQAGGDVLLGAWVADRFEVVERVAAGSMGRVYRAVQHPLGRAVALKVLHVQHEDVKSGDYTERFLREASALGRLNHPNTVRIFDFGIWKGRSYLIMELVEGRTLAEEIRIGPLEPPRALRIARQICASLAEAHEQGIVHRDLKPGNILLTDHGDEVDFVKVVDFGLVKDDREPDELARVGQIVGSPHYMAPEQIRGEEVDHRVDIYALGCMLFNMLRGAAPFPGREAPAVLVAHLTGPVPAVASVRPELDLPEALTWTLSRMLAKKQEDRFEDVRQLGRALKACQLALLEPGLAGLRLQLEGGQVVLPAHLTDISLSTSTQALTLTDSLMPVRVQTPTGPFAAAPSSRRELGADRTETIDLDASLDEPSLPPRRGAGDQVLPVLVGALLSLLVGLGAIWAFAPHLLSPGGAP